MFRPGVDLKCTAGHKTVACELVCAMARLRPTEHFQESTEQDSLASAPPCPVASPCPEQISFAEIQPNNSILHNGKMLVDSLMHEESKP